MIRRRIAAIASVALASLAGGCASVAPEPSPLPGFAHLASGEWTTTLASGEVLRETWRWGPDGRSLRVTGRGEPDATTPWREEQVFFVDPSTGTVRVRGTNSFRDGSFEGTVTFGERSAEAHFVLTQEGQRRHLVRRWSFLGEDLFETELLEFVDPGDVTPAGLVPLVSWTYARSR
ncbi:MAG: hypothetical protein RLY21_1272 [Planctomycetota bacterium]